MSQARVFHVLWFRSRDGRRISETRCDYLLLPMEGKEQRPPSEAAVRLALLGKGVANRRPGESDRGKNFQRLGARGGIGNATH